MNIHRQIAKYKVKIQKIRSVHNNIGDSPYHGYTDNLPTVGEMFVMNSEYLHTTPVTELMAGPNNTSSEGAFQFKTKHSTYELHYELNT